MRILVPALLSALFLTGCALPPVVTLASLAASGASYAKTGKSTTDHAISAVVGEDCALHRIFGDEAVCDPDGEMLAVLVGAKTADEDWYLDPETGRSNFNYVAPASSANAIEAADDTTPTQPPQLSTLPIVPKNEDTIVALAPAPTGNRKNHRPLENLIALAVEPAPRGLFADARPAPKPEVPLGPDLQVQDPQTPTPSTRWYARLTEKTRGIFSKPRP